VFGGVSRPADPLRTSVNRARYLGADGRRALRGHILGERSATKF